MSTAMRKSSTPAMENAGSVMPSASSTGFPAIPHHQEHDCAVGGAAAVP